MKNVMGISALGLIMLILTLPTCREGKTEDKQVKEPQDTVGHTSTALGSDEYSGQLIQGSIELRYEEDTTGVIITIGLIAIKIYDDVYWLQYFNDTTIMRREKVWFQLEEITKGDFSTVVAIKVTNIKPLSLFLSGNAVPVSWIRGKTVQPHGLFAHPGGTTWHKPGHIINTYTGENIELAIKSNGSPITTHPGKKMYEKVQIRYSTLDTENVYVREDWTNVLKRATVGTDKFYFLDFYETSTSQDYIKINGLRVLRMYSVDHNHPGHLETITVEK